MILRLIDIKSRLKIESEFINKATKWMKKVNCYKYRKKRHIIRICKISKKDWVQKDNKKNENKALGNKKPKKNKDI